MNTTGVQIVENGYKANKSFLNKVEKFFGIKAGKHIKPLEQDAVEIGCKSAIFTPKTSEVVYYSPRVAPHTPFYHLIES